MVDWSGFAIARGCCNPWLSLAIGHTVGSITQYSLNKSVTFKNKCEKTHIQIGVYTLVAIASFAMREGLLSFFLNVLKLSGDLVLFHHEVKNLLLTVMSTAMMLPVNYLMSRFIVFNKQLIR